MTSDFVEKLRQELGPENVLAEPASLLVYSYDGALDKNLPGAVALPRTTEQVAAAVRLARREGVPFVARGAGTNLCGGSVPREGGLVIHLARLNRILGIDAARRRAWVEPGVVNLHLQKAVAPHGLFYAPDPASQKASTLGGNVGTNAGGPHCLKHGVTTHHVTGLEVVLPDGEVVSTSVEEPGYDLTGLLVGSEGTLGIVTKIEVRLLPVPEDVQTLLVSFPSMESAVHAVTDIIYAGIVPTTLEVMDKTTVQAVEAFLKAGYPQDAEAVLLIEVDGPRPEISRDTEKIKTLCRRHTDGEIRQARDEKEREKLWEGRRGSYPAMARLAPNVLVEDGVVPRQKLPEAVRRIRAIAARDNIRMGLIAHAGDGNLHPNMIFDERDAEETRRVKAAGYEMLKVCVDLGGSISGEHGIGTDKREAMRWLFTPATLHFFRRLKQAFDPENLCNPDKLIPPPACPPKAGPVGPDPTTCPDCKAGVPSAGRWWGEAGGGIIPAVEAPGPSESSFDFPQMKYIRPGDVQSLQNILRAAHARKKPVGLKGLGTQGTPAPPEALLILMDGFKNVIDHDRANFTLTVEAGATLESLKALLEPCGQYLHLAGPGTLGGLLSARACRRPRLRDQVIGLKAVLPDGQLIELGAKVMKNVAGYDAIKLFIGAWGTLGAITQVTLRLFPFPPEEVEPEPSPSPFKPTALHRRIKRAVDPDNFLNSLVFQEPSHG